jgi:syntaxin-binding protein 5
VYVLKYDAEEVKLVQMPYHVPADVAEGNDLILY